MVLVVRGDPHNHHHAREILHHVHRRPAELVRYQTGAPAPPAAARRGRRRRAPPRHRHPLNALLDAPAPPPGIEVDLEATTRQVLDAARSAFTQCQDNPEHSGTSFYPPLDALGLDIPRKTEIWVVATVAHWENRGRIPVISHTKAHWRRSPAGTVHRVLDHLTIRWPSESRRGPGCAVMHYFDTNRRNNT